MGWTAAFVLLAAMWVNVALMLFSPRLWFRLPKWLLANGRFTPRDAADFGRALGIRITGALLAVVLVIMTLAFLGDARA